jgi:hypothetical protein
MKKNKAERLSPAFATFTKKTHRKKPFEKGKENYTIVNFHIFFNILTFCVSGMAMSFSSSKCPSHGKGEYLLISALQQ